MTNEKIRLLKFLNFFAIGGTERQFVNLVKRIDPSRFDVQIGCFQKVGPFLADIEACGRPVTAFQISSMRSCETLRRQPRWESEGELACSNALPRTTTLAGFWTSTRKL